MKRGPLIILSGPSGSGKSTLIDCLLQDCPCPLRLAISATTRPRRLGEVDGEHYLFWNEGHFRQAIDAGEFLEWARVHDHFYGTPIREVEPYLAKGTGVILDIDVQGAQQVRTKYPEHLSVFLSAPDYAQRLRERGTENEAGIQRRLLSAQRELARAHEFEQQLVNDDLDRTVHAFRRLIEQYIRKGAE